MKIRARKLRQLRPPERRVRLGIAAGLFVVPDDFDSPLPPDVLASFEGDIEPPKSTITGKPVDLED